MFTQLMPTGPDEGVLVGIDPGSDTVGIATMTIRLSTLEILRTEAFTLMCSRLAPHQWLADTYGDRYSRMKILEEFLTNFFQRTRPFSITIEAPFINFLRPAAYGVLMEVKSAIRQAVYNYDMYTVLEEIDPSSIKNAIGAKGNANKDAVNESLLKILPELRLATPLTHLDEHSIDAIAVVYTKYKRCC